MVLAVAAMASVSALAQPETEIDSRFALRIAAEHSDNPGRADESSRPEALTFASAGLDMGFDREGRRVLAFLDSSLDYYHYDSDDLENETLGYFIGGLQLRLLPETLVWDLERESGDVRSDPFRSAGPGNRERLTITTTGPTLTLPLSARDFFSTTVRRMDRDWDESGLLDSTVDSGGVSWFRDLGSSQEFGLSANQQRISYDSESVPNYDISSAFLTYSRGLPSGGMSLGVGNNRIAAQGRSDDGLYLDLVWQRRLAAYSSISLTGGQQFEDAGDQLRIDEPDMGNDDVTNDIPSSFIPFERTRLGFEYELGRTRLGFSVGNDWSQERYEVANVLDRDRSRFFSRAEYLISEITAVDVYAYRSREEYLDDSSIVMERGASLGITHDLGNVWSLGFRYLRRSRDSDVGVDYTENRYTLTLTWAPRD